MREITINQQMEIDTNQSYQLYKRKYDEMIESEVKIVLRSPQKNIITKKPKK